MEETHTNLIACSLKNVKFLFWSSTSAVDFDTVFSEAAFSVRVLEIHKVIL